MAGTCRVAVLIPALDEEEALPLVLREIPSDVVEFVLVVDNGSTDRTAEEARAAGAEVVREPRRGYGRACLTGLAVLLERGVPGRRKLGADDVVVFLDGDHSDYPADLVSILEPVLADEADLVIGSRMLSPESRRALLPQARLGNRLAGVLLRLLFGARMTDLGPLRAIRVRALRHLAMRDENYGWTVEMQIKAAVAGLRWREVPVRYRSRIGRSKISGTLSGSLRAAWKILGWITIWRLRLLTGRGIPRYR